MRLIAALLASMPLTVNGQAQLLPAGEFQARDGRPGPGKTWKLDDTSGPALAASLNAIAAKTPFQIDYEHQTIKAATNGQPSPASGWITSVEWRSSLGLFGTVDWTDRAKGYIASKEYRYISPVILHTQDNEITGLYNVALVGVPALLGMEPVMAQLSAQLLSTTDPTESDMATTLLLASLLAAIGLPADTTEAAALTHVKTACARPPVPTALSAALGLAATVDEAAATTAIAALKTKPPVPAALVTALGLAATADESAVLAAITTLKSGTDSTTQLVAQLQSEVNVLKGAGADRSLGELLDKAIADDKITPASRENYAAIGRSNMSALTTLIAALPSIPGLKGQTGGKGPRDLQAAVLSAQTTSVAAQFGHSADDLKKFAPAAA